MQIINKAILPEKLLVISSILVVFVGICYSHESECDSVSNWGKLRLEDYPTVLEPVEINGISVETSTDVFPDLDWLLEASDYVIFGYIVNKRYEFGKDREGFLSSLAVLELHIDKLYWGPQTKSLVIETKFQCDECHLKYNRKKFTSFNVGEMICVIGNKQRGQPCNSIREFGLFKIFGETVLAENGKTFEYYDFLKSINKEKTRRLLGRKHRWE